jgi:hypothetical protein
MRSGAMPVSGVHNLRGRARPGRLLRWQRCCTRAFGGPGCTLVPRPERGTGVRLCPFTPLAVPVRAASWQSGLPRRLRYGPDG